MESFDEAHRVPGVSGLIEITTSKNNESNTYSVEEFVEIFTPVFGEFSIETKATSNPLGKDVIKKDASAIHGGAKMQITDVVSDENKNYIVLKIESLDYLNKKNAFEMESASDKIKSAKSDF